MEEKLRNFIASENLTASKFAEILDVKPAAISHILKGRNKPSCEMLCKIVTRFPNLNPYWLMGDAEDMYKSEDKEEACRVGSTSEGTLFDQESASSQQCDNSNIGRVSEMSQISQSPNEQNAITPTMIRTDIEKILIIYKDQTFEEIRPKNLL